MHVTVCRGSAWCRSEHVFLWMCVCCVHVWCTLACVVCQVWCIRVHCVSMLCESRESVLCVLCGGYVNAMCSWYESVEGRGWRRTKYRTEVEEQRLSG